MTDLIEAMCKAQHEAFDPPVAWEDCSQALRDNHYDSMWKALHLLKEPSDEMLAAAGYPGVFTESGSPKEAWTQMINKLLEVKNQ